MKKYISFLIIAFSLCITAMAQDTYYYYGSEKVDLKENSKKLVTITSSFSTSAISHTGFQFVSTIADTKSYISVYEFNPSAYSVKQAKIASGKTSFGASAVQSCYISAEGMELIPTGYIYIKLKTERDYSILANTANQYNLEIVEQNEFMPLWYTLRQKENSSQSAIEVANAIYETGKFASSSPNFAFDGLEISYDADVDKQWGLYNSQYEGFDISVSPAWNYATGRGIKIAIVDQGIELTHQDLSPNIYYMSYDTETRTSPSKVYGAHGTHCAGIAAAVRNNGIQVAGVAPDAKLISVSNSLRGVTKLEENLANGINWAWQNGADVISCSWWCAKEKIIEDAIDLALTKGREGKGCIFVKSAGNTGGAISYPGDYRKEVLAIANMRIDGTLSGSSAFGDNLFVTAPGSNILSTIPGNSTSYMSGTSMAAPHVAGLAALILERNPKLTAAQVREIIAKNTKKIGNYTYDTTKQYGSWNKHYGYGVIDAYHAVLNTPRY